MGLQRVPRQAFNRGKISRLGLGRTDVDRVEFSAEEQTNWVPRVLGSMMLRPGWKYLGSTLSDSQAFLIPFIKSTDDTAFVEFTNESLRVWEDDTPITRNAVSTTIRGGDFSSDMANFLKIADPGTNPAGNAYDVVYSADGQLCAVAHDSTPFITIYSISGTTFTKLANPANLPSTNCRGVAFSPDGSLFAVAIEGGNNLILYSVAGTGASAVFTKLTDPANLPAGLGEDVAFSPDGTMLAVAHFTSPFVTIYSISGTTFTKLSDPGTLPTGSGLGCSWSHDGRFLAVAHSASPFVTIYEVNGTTFTKLSNPGTLPTGNGTATAFTRDGAYMAVSHAASPFVSIYSISGTTFTKVADPGTLPGGNGNNCDFSTDNQFLAVAHTTTPFLTVYQNVAGVFNKVANPATLPDGDGQGVGYSPNSNFLSVTHSASTFITNYQWTQWLDLDGTGAASTFGGVSSNWVQSSAWGTSDGAAGSDFNGSTVRQIVDAGQLTRSGNKVRITFKGETSATLSINKCYIGTQASSGDAYDFASAPTQVTFNGGSAGFSGDISAGLTSDEITFTVDEATSYIVSFHVTSNQFQWFSKNSAGNNRVFYRAIADDVATVNTSGYTEWTSNDEVVGISKIEVYETSGTSFSGLKLVGTNYADARRVQAVSVLNADKATEHGIRLVVAQGLVQFHVGTEFGDDDLVTRREFGPGVYSFAFIPNVNLFFVELHSFTKYSSYVTSVQIDGGGDLTLETPYTTADLQFIRYAQSGDVIFIACRDVEQQKVMRFGSHSWGVADYLPEDGPFRNENSDFTTLTASALTGDITITASKDYFKEGMIGTLFRITSVGQATQDSFTGANQFSTHIKVTNVGTARDLVITRSGTWTATITLQRSIGEPGTWVDVSTFTSNGTATYNDGLDNQVIYYRIGIKTGDYTSGTAVVSLSYASGSKNGIARITAISTAKIASAIVLSPMGGTTAFEIWAEGIWSDYRGWPSSVALYEGRLAWAGMDRIILSESDAFENFDDTVEGDSGPIIRQIGEGPVDDIHWLLPLQRLLAGAEGSELSIRSNSFDEPLTPDNFNMKAASTQGSAPVGAIRIDSNGVFVERSTTRVYQLTYNFDTYDYSSSDLTRLIPDQNSAGIIKIVLQRHPDTRLHCVLEDGTVSLLVFEPDENVICWIDIETDGDIEDAVVLPQQELEDAVYYVVKRTINGETKRYVEKWALEEECIGGTLNKQADSFILYSGAPTSTITGLSHLEGESVVVWGDGAFIGIFTVSSGQITGLSPSVSSAVVGLTYRARYKSSKLAYAAQSGTALNAVKAIAGLGIIAADIHHKGVRYGDNFNFLRDLPQVYKHKDVAVNTVHTAYDDNLIPINRSWDTDSRLCLQADAPKPATILALTMVIDTSA